MTRRRPSSVKQISGASRGVRAVVVLSGALATLLAPAAASATAQPTSMGPATLPGALWGVELEARGASRLQVGAAKRLARGGLTSVFLGNVPPAAEARVRRIASKSGLTVFGRFEAAAP